MSRALALEGYTPS